MLESGSSDPILVKKAIQLFSFLGGAQRLKERPVYRTENFESCSWFDSFPSHPAVSLHAPDEDSPSNGIIASFMRVPRLVAPEPGDELVEWIEGASTDPASRPVVRETIFSNSFPKTDDETQPGAHGSKPEDDVESEPAESSNRSRTREISLKDHPEVEALLDAWAADWDLWAAQELRNRPARELYGSMFSTMEKVGNHGDEFEVVLGMACLAWAPEEHEPVNRHLLTAPVRFECDDETGEIVVVHDDSRDPLAVEVDMLDARLITNPESIDEVKSLARAFDGHPLDRSAVAAIARRLVHRLDAEAEYDEEAFARPRSETPKAAFAPAIVLRKRSQRGIVDIYERIVAHLAESGQVPDGVLPLIDPNHRPAASPDVSEGAVVSLGTDIYLPLPVNEKQRQVIEHVDRFAQTLVQGPPGTGKTHTAAALVSHLLAQGKRVLITAQTDQALKEVRDKLPHDIRPLAVSVIGQSRSDMSDLKVAVERISTNASEHDPHASTKRIEALARDIDVLYRKRASAYSEMVKARVAEVTPHEHASYEGTLAAMARQHQAAEPVHGWIRAYELLDAETSAPLSNESALTWLRLLNDDELMGDEEESQLQLISISDIPDAETFGAQTQLERDAASRAQLHEHLVAHVAFQAVSELPGGTRTELQDRMRQISSVAQSLESRRESWMIEALTDVRTGRASIWDARAREVEQLLAKMMPLLTELGATSQIQVSSGEHAIFKGQALSLLAYLVDGGKIKTQPDGTPKIGAFTGKAIKNAEAFFSAVRVDGLPATTPATIQLFLTWVEADRTIDALDRAWPANIVIPPEDTLRERAQWHQTELEQLRKVLALGRRLEIDARWLDELEIPVPNWTDLGEIKTYAVMVEAAAAGEDWVGATLPIRELESRIEAVTRLGTSAPAVQTLLEAVRTRNVSLYSATHNRLDRLHLAHHLVQTRDDLGQQVREAAPELFHAVTASRAAPEWRTQFGSFSEAWDWMTTGTWIINQDSTDVNVLQTQMNLLDGRISRKVEALAGERAWNHAVSSDRIDGSSRAALTQYAQLVQRLGKGTGKYADARRKEIRDAMDRCRSSVPVWIMPTYRIAEQLRVEPNMFDVVIVDEASQAGLDATFLQFLAPRMVVIGDDKQVSPTAVGVDQQKLRDLAHQYIAGDPYIASWQDPQRSLFDEAKMRFGGLITLVEHRRCVPEIIGFSNRIAYEPDGIRLIPVRQYGADRLEPIKPVHVTDGYEQGKINPAEAEAIVEQIVACIADNRYDGKSFGVISLLGKDQSNYISNLLLDRIGPDEWFSRDLRCGDAPDFQGSERDVMFLSMVKAPMADKRIGALTQDMFVQRFNVAASRAKDQLWVFHSMSLSDLGNPEDMRFALLDYCYGVVGRSNYSDELARSEVVPEDLIVEPFDSLFEQRVFNRLIDRGLTVIPQFDSNGYRIDLVVVGGKSRLAIECDGDHWHGPEQYEKDLARQRDLERCGWTFFRIRESSFYVDTNAVLTKLWAKLEEMGIRPSSWVEEIKRTSVEIDSNPHVLTIGGVSASEVTDDSDAPESGAIERVASSELTIAEILAVAAAWPEDEADELPSTSARTRRRDQRRAPSSAIPAAELEPVPFETDDGGMVIAEVVDGDTDLPTTAPESDVQVETEVSHAGDEPTAVSDPASTQTGHFDLDGQLPPYAIFTGKLTPASTATSSELLAGILEIVALEGPIVGHRLHEVYVKASGGQRVGRETSRILNSAISRAVATKQLVADNPLADSGMKPKTFRLPHQPEVRLRHVGPRSLEHIPPTELATLMEALRKRHDHGQEALMRATLDAVGLKYMTSGVREKLLGVQNLLSSAH
ncbi:MULTISPECIES: AAA domain-containing protein [unclassified Cryobacterium]|uniref:AAA domain-containing protein n=1 Tax=unclassified Cryobacterium TaxID=2649013 RepID=UPI00141AEF64|nr:MULTISPECIES: AAA domain-containing protein [unclassified Cryobacterium]